MKKTLNFSKGFIPCTILSCVLIVLGIVGLFTKGVNLGIDFKPGLVEEVRIVEPVASLKYDGAASISVSISAGQMDVVITGTGVENQTISYNYLEYPTVAKLAEEVNKVEGLEMTVLKGDFDSTKLFLNSAVTNQVTNVPMYVYPLGASKVTIDDVRAALDGVESLSIKELSSEGVVSFQIRKGVSDLQTAVAATEKAAEKVADAAEKVEEAVESADVEETEELAEEVAEKVAEVVEEVPAVSAQSEVLALINNKLYEKFGFENVAVIKQDFIGSAFSSSIAKKSVLMFILTVFVIWLYAAIRFHWDFALGSVIALIHDTLIMMTFIIWTQLEFNTTVLAAVLTIIGYSINATVVILDRIRYNLKYMTEVKSFKEILNKSLSDTLLRSILTTATTLIAVISLFVFTTGSIKDFSLAMIVGLVSGMYSSIFISSAFIAACRKNWKPEFGVHHSLKQAQKAAAKKVDVE